MSVSGANGAGVNRPGRNGTYIRFHDETLNGTTVLAFDCGYSTNVIYSGTTIIINTAPHIWTFGHFYYVTLDSGRFAFVRINRDDTVGTAFRGVEWCWLLSYVSSFVFTKSLWDDMFVFFIIVVIRSRIWASDRSDLLAIQHLGSWPFEHNNNYYHSRINGHRDYSSKSQ